MNIPENIIPAILLTVAAGLGTGIGSAIAYFIRKPKIVYLAFLLGLSAGVMIYVSFMELMPSALQAVGKLWSLAAFFVGIAAMGLVDILVPEFEHPNQWQTADCEDKPPAANLEKSRLMRTGLFTALAIGIHNFPEGLATFTSAITDLHLGIFIAIAIAIHNIPEGIAVSVPILYATGDKKKAFFYSFLSGMSEPVGAIVGYVVLLPFLTPALLAALLAFVAGVMVYISLDELLPMAHRYGHGHLVIAGVVLGMFVMAVSLLML
ncbi:MAG: zinc transporter ZupT [Phycisphaerae bacterium]|jgi:ZIP family zinc transporter